VIVGLLAIAALTWWLRTAIESDEADAPRTVGASPAAPPAPAEPTRAPRAALPLPAMAPGAPPPRPELHGHDMADPCKPVGEPSIPADYTTLTASDITVAWSPKTPAGASAGLHATSVAYLTAGVLEEAAALTGTQRLGSLTVVVYPRDEFKALTGVPLWADGVYDGAVRLPMAPYSELGISIGALRHEAMHAQLHAGVGCIPAWFNEGSAMHFAGGDVPVREWVRWLRAHDSLDLAELEGPTFSKMSDARADRLYALSLAMVMFAVDHARGDGLLPAVRTALALAQRSPGGSLELWERLVPGADQRTLQDWIARRLFGVGGGNALDAKLRGGVCCYGLRALDDTTCSAVAARPGRTEWYDTDGPRPGLCFAVR